METIRSYLLSVIAAAIICGIVTQLVNKKGTVGTMVRLLASLFLTFTVLSPIAHIRLDGLADFTSQYTADAQQAADLGASLTKEALAERIKDQTQAYILDKAAVLNTELSVEVTLTDDEVPVPAAVQLSGQISPYAKSQLTDLISEDLGIDKEHQTWI